MQASLEADETYSLAKTGAGNVPVLTEWFYPGLESGYQFIYSANQERRLQQAKEEMVIAHPESAAGE